MFYRSVLTRLNSSPLIRSITWNRSLNNSTTLRFDRSTTALLLSAKRTYCKDKEIDGTLTVNATKDQEKDVIKKEDDKEEVSYPEQDKPEISVYDLQETVEDVRKRLIKEGEICVLDEPGLYMYPAGFDYYMKTERIQDLEKIDVQPFRDLNAQSLIQSTVLIVGGGLLGASIAYWIRELGTDICDANLIDRDFKQLYSNSGLSATGIQQQFTTRECIELSHYSAEFLRTTRRNLNVFNKEPPDVDYCPTGNLILAQQSGVQQMMENVGIQNELGQKTILMDKIELSKQFPWLNCSDIEAGSMGLEHEGHFNSQALLRSLKIKAENLQARFWECEFVDFNLRLISVTNWANIPLKVEQARQCLVRDKGNDLFMIDFDNIVIAAGPENYKFGKLLGLGDTTHPEPTMRFPIPLKKRKRYYYAFESDNGPGIDFPLLMDPSGVFCRPDNYAGRYITGKLPSEDEEIDNNNSDVDYKYFDNIIKPVLINRVPAFKDMKLLRGWSCFEDVNTYDGMPLIGDHPFYHNVTFVGGLGIHAAALAPAVGRCVAEKILFDQYKTVDLTRFGWERFFTDYKFENKENLKF